MENKTNVMRILDGKKIEYIPHFYPHGDDIPTDGITIANFLQKNTDTVYKTLVTQAASKAYYVFVIPVDKHLDLKKAAKSVKEKSIEMIKQDNLLPLTGYIHGGCSPIGMKKRFKTTFHNAVLNLETVTLSAGRVGAQIEIDPATLIKFVGGQTADIISD
ncbi:MAG: Cys-tRNA(Pro) deacylase [Ruminococcus sp.]|nr:Cys-tRNA(Pro) deacylase [Candidatus Copronaster equi]